MTSLENRRSSSSSFDSVLRRAAGLLGAPAALRLGAKPLDCAALLLAGGLAACTVTTTASPSELCEDLATAICDRMLECADKVGAQDKQSARAQARASCERMIEEQFDCSTAVGVSDKYDRCVEAVGEASCSLEIEAGRITDLGIEMPAACSVVIEQP